MPSRLEESDVLTINHLQDDKKSFRQILRETCITTSAVKSGFERLGV
jgi:hypothetical protein